MDSASMHRAVRALLGSALAFALGQATPAAAGCPKTSAPQVLLERFTPADCEACWQTAPKKAPALQDPRVVVLDWIVPTTETAAMAAAALPEASERAGSLAADQTLWRQQPLKLANVLHLRVADGPAWNGYIGLQLTVRRHGKWPAGAVAYAALVERVPAGSEGTPMARQLVRVLVGPLPLQELATQTQTRHLKALRLPATDRVERLSSVAWVEDAAGHVLAATQATSEPCASP